MTVHLPFQPLPLDLTDVRYVYGPDSSRQPGVPAGRTEQFAWTPTAPYAPGWCWTT